MAGSRAELARWCVCVGGLLLLLPPLTWLRVCSVFQQRTWTAVEGGHFSIWEGGADLPTAQTLLLLYLLDGPSALPAVPFLVRP